MAGDRGTALPFGRGMAKDGEHTPGVEPTLAASSGVEPTLAASSGVEPTLAASSGAEPTLAAPSASGPRAKAGDLKTVSGDGYTRGGEIARGGMGRIVAARDRHLDREVAIKELLSQHPQQEARFEREIRITAKLSHPSIINLQEAGRWPSGELFYSMRHVDGSPLTTIISATKTVEERVALLPHLIAVADAIAYAHSEGVIHRDIKPGNVLVGSFGETVVIDWGLAKTIGEPEPVDTAATAATADAASGGWVTDTLEYGERATPVGKVEEPPESSAGSRSTEPSDDELTRAGSVLGTPAYMSPEQGRGEELDERTDVYAIGAMLYRVLTGKPPYGDSTSVEHLLSRLLSGPPNPIAEQVEGIPPDLVAIAEKAMAHDRNERYHTAGALAEELRRFQTGQLVGAHSYTTWQLVRRWLARHKAAVAVAAIALLVVVAGATLSVNRVVDERDRAKTARSSAEIAKSSAELAEGKALDRLATLFAQQGQQAMKHRRYDEAAVYLSRAYSMGVNTAGLRTMLARAMTTLERRRDAVVIEAGGDVADIVYTHDGASIVAHSRKSLAAWNTRTGKNVAVLTADGIKGFTMSPDGHTVVAVTKDQRVLAWDTRTWKEKWAVPAKPGGKRVTNIAFTRDSSLVTVPVFGRGLEVFDNSTGALLYTVAEPTAISAEFSPDKKLILIGTLDRRYKNAVQAQVELGGANKIGATFSVWDATTHKRLRTMTAGSLAVATMRVVNNREVILLAGDALQHWDYALGKKLGSLELHGANDSLRLDPSGTVAIASARGKAVEWSITHRRRRLSYDGAHDGMVDHTGFSPDGRNAFTRGSDGVLHIWERSSGGIVVTLVAPNAIRGAGTEFAPDGKRIAMAIGARIEIVDYAKGQRFAVSEKRITKVRGVSVSPDGTQAAISAGKPTNVLVSVNPPKILRTLLPGAKHPAVARFARSAHRVLVNSHGALATIDSKTGKQLARWQGNGRRAALSPDGTRVLAQTTMTSVSMFEAGSGKLLWKKPGPKSMVISARFSEDGSIVSVGTVAGAALLYRVADGSMTKLGTHQGPSFAIGFTTDGKRAVFSFFDGKARVWDLRTNKKVLTFPANMAAVAIGKAHIVAGTQDGIVTVHDAMTGAKQRSWRASTTPLQMARMDKSGRRLFTSPRHGPVRLWDIETGTMIDEFGPHHGSIIWANFVSDDKAMLVMGGDDDVFKVWQTSLEERAPADIARLVACLGRFKLDGDHLADNQVAPKRCR